MKKTALCLALLLCVATAASAQTPEAEDDTTAIAARQYAPTRMWRAAENDFRATFEALVEELNLKDGVQDLSEATEIRIAEPRFAYVNLTGISGIPSSKHTEKRAWMEVYDGQGNYFRKPLLIKGQGGYSLRFPKRNFSVQFCDADWTETVTPDFHIGRWVRQDGFHFKAFYTDFTRGIGEIGYKWFRRVVADRRPFWERGGYIDPSDALCVPDGFPCAVYLNGQFHGIFAWQLKKHRRNMNMKKNIATHIHLDGNISDKYLFDGDIDWDWFEVRNPKGLYTKKNTAYEGNYPEELMDERSSGYDENDPDKVLTAQVKRAVIALSKYKKELQALESRGPEMVRSEFAKRFDVESLIDYQVFFRIQMNGDGTLKNWQWFTYDGVKWMVAPYDLDQTMGITLYGFPRPATHARSTVDTGPFPLLTKYFFAEERARYIELRRSGVFSEETILPIIHDWYNRVGEDWYVMEKSRWPESPCYCEAICNDGWQVCDDWSRYNGTPQFDYGKTYNQGDICILDGRIWEATRRISGVKPYKRNSDIDTLSRLVSWVTDRLRVVDAFYEYEHQASGIDSPALPSGERRIMAVFDLRGRRLPALQKGMNLVRYSDGTSRVVVKE